MAEGLNDFDKSKIHVYIGWMESVFGVGCNSDIPLGLIHSTPCYVRQAVLIQAKMVGPAVRVWACRAEMGCISPGQQDAERQVGWARGSLGRSDDRHQRPVKARREGVAGSSLGENGPKCSA